MSNRFQWKRGSPENLFSWTFLLLLFAGNICAAEFICTSKSWEAHVFYIALYEKLFVRIENRCEDVYKRQGLAVFQLCKFHLNFTFICRGAFCKDVKDDQSAIHDFRIQCILEISKLCRRELIITNCLLYTSRCV